MTQLQRTNRGSRREVEGMAKCEIDIKEGTCDENWVLYVSYESPNSTPETNLTVYVN